MAARSSRFADLDNAYERERQQRIAGNQQRLESMGISKQKSLLDTAFRSVRHQSTLCKLPKVKGTPPTRQSQRLHKSEANAQLPAPQAGGEQQQKVAVADANAAWLLKRERRCDQKGRGSIYDSTAGITCHFCRQKKLCGEEGCPRCSERDVEQDCIGKSECSRCESACGRFCRACLLVRYGLQLEEVQQHMAAGTWLCPHCYEEDHPDEGWICNSSICMTKRGMKPTGIAIFEAQQRGFASVAHYVQAQLVSKASIRTAKCETECTSSSLFMATCSNHAAVDSKASDCAASSVEVQSQPARLNIDHAASSCNADTSCSGNDCKGVKNAAQAEMNRQPAHSASKDVKLRATSDANEIDAVRSAPADKSAAIEQQCTGLIEQTTEYKPSTPVLLATSSAHASCASISTSKAAEVSLEGHHAAGNDNKLKDVCGPTSSKCQTRSRTRQTSLMSGYVVPIQTRAMRVQSQ